MPSTPRPIVVATGPDEPADPYVRALLACGATPESVRVVDDAAAGAAAALVAGAAGLLLCGGVDVGPERYGESELAGVALAFDRRRDAFELDLLAAARAAQVPVFGVCRGLQLLNVFFGGSLFQDLPVQRPGAVMHSVEPQETLVHGVFVENRPHPMAQLLRREPCVVNSVHHQAIRRLADDLEPIAVAADELVEAAALPAAHPWWLRGVQWHPENLVELPLQRQLWRSFLAATAGASHA